MKRKTFINSLLVCCLVAGLTLIADLTGKWSGVLKMTDGNEFPLSYTFKVDGNKLTGTASGPEGDVPLDSGKFNGTDLTFSVQVQGMPVPHKGKYYGDSVGLDITYNGQTMHTTLKRASN